MKKIFFALIPVLLTLLPMAAKYTIHSFTGDVKISSRSRTVRAQKGLEVTGLEKVLLSNNSSVELLNSSDSKIYKCDKPGEYSVAQIMFLATNKSKSNVSNVNKAMRFGATEQKSSKVYQDKCAVTRSLKVYDPEASAIQVDAVTISNLLVHSIKNNAFDTLPVNLSSWKDEENNGLEFRIDNQLDFPIYVNVLRYNPAIPHEINISQLGQPVGCYILLPGQSMMRSQMQGLNPEEVHLLLTTHCYFDIDAVIDNASEFLTDSSADSIPEKVTEIYITSL